MPSYTVAGPGHMEPRQSGNESASLPLAEILGLAVGTPTFFVFLVLVIVHYLRRKHRNKKKKLEEIDNADCRKEIGVPMRPARTSDLCISTRSSLNPMLPHGQASTAISNEWLEDESMMDDPPLTKSRSRRRPQMNLMTGMRDSWPLAASIQMPNMSHRFGLQQNSSVVPLNQVAPPGYIVPPEPKWPSRTFSRLSRTQISVSAEESKAQRFSTGSIEPQPAPAWPRNHRRSISENQLSTILRSTSQRLKNVHRNSLSRTLASFDRSPGPPPMHKLKTPQKATTGSREILIDHTEDHAESIASSIYGAYLNRTPSPSNQESRACPESSQKRRRSLSPSITSDDSLCTSNHSDLVIPAALTSPSKPRSKSPQKLATQIPSGVKDFSEMIHKDSTASVLALSTQSSPEGKSALRISHRVSTESDPFYSSVKRSKFTTPQNRILGPRPLYIRQTNFGREATSERPASFVSTSLSTSTLRDISGNAQQPSIKRSPSPTPASSEEVINPFQWEPQEAMTARDARSSPQHSRTRRRGHQRSNVMRISLAPSPPTVHPLFEDAEDNHSKSNVRHHSSMHIIEPIKDLRPRPLSTWKLTLDARPPSIAKFNPILPISGRTTDIRPLEDGSATPVNDVKIYSPTLAALNSYLENPSSEEEVFNKRPSSGILSSLGKLQRHQRTSSIPHPEHKELFCFQPPSNSDPSTLSTSFGLSPLLNSLAEYTTLPERSPMLPDEEVPSSLRLISPSDGGTFPTAMPLHGQASAPKTVQLTSPSMTLTSPDGVSGRSPLSHFSPAFSQSHLASPRSQAPRLSPNNNLLNPRDSLLHQSICMLRRMNSEVSQCSTISASSNVDEEGKSGRSPSMLTSQSPVLKSWGTGSKNYLNMGENPQKSRAERRPSKRASREKIDEEDAEDEDDTFSDSGLNTTKATGSEFGGKVSPHTHGTLDSNQTTIGIRSPNSTPTPGPLTTKPWSDATPPAGLRSTRDESQIQSPSPVTPPKWGWGSKDQVDQGGKENVAEVTPTKMKYGNWNGNFGRPDSLGLYDADGFLINSPRNKDSVLNI